MSQISLRFLLDSVLLDTEAQESHFSGLTDAELLSILSGYREHVIKHLKELQGEISSSHDRLGAYFGVSLCSVPKIRQLLRASLYYDVVVIDDPLFPHGRPSPSASGAYATFLGYKSGAVDRRAVARAASLVKTLQPLVASGLLKLVPASLPHEPPSELTILYSPSLFAETVPEPLLDWFHDRADVSPMVRHDGGGWEPRPAEKLEPCRGIFIRLRGFDEARVFHLMATDFQERVPGREDLFHMRQSIPEQPPDRGTFQAWITQSLNQFSGNVYARVESDMTNAAATDTMMFTDSPLVSDLLELRIGEHGKIEDALASLAMRFELPFLDDSVRRRSDDHTGVGGRGVRELQSRAAATAAGSKRSGS